MRVNILKKRQMYLFYSLYFSCGVIGVSIMLIPTHSFGACKLTIEEIYDEGLLGDSSKSLRFVSM